MSEDNRRAGRPDHPGGFPSWLIVFGVFVGLLLIGGGGAAYWKYGGQPVVHLLVSVGLGLVLALFGTQAKLDYRHYTITGGAAVGVIFFVLLQKYVPPPQMPCDVTWGTLKKVGGRFPKGTDIAILDQGNQLLGALAGGNVLYRFIVKGDRLADAEPDLAIQESEAAPLLSFRLKSDLLNSYLSKRQDLDLRYDVNRQQIIDRASGGVVGTLLGPLAETPTLSPGPTLGFLSVVRDAFAAEPSVEDLLQTSRQGDLRYRVEARSAIVKAGPGAVEPLVSSLRSRPDVGTQADTLSIMVTLFRSDDAARVKAVEVLQPADLRNLTPLLGNDDRNVRWIATLFFETLRDPEAAEPLEQVALNGVSPAERFNALYALESLLAFLPAERSAAIVAAVHARADAEPDEKVKRSMQGFDTARYHLVVASYSSEAEAITRAQQLRATSGYPDASAYRLNNSSRFVTTVGTTRLRDAQQEKATAITKGIAQADAWPTTDSAFQKQVFPQVH
jgi:hypothetical protein